MFEASRSDETHRPTGRRGHLRLVGSETPGGYRATAGVAAEVERLCSRDVDVLDEPAVRAELAALEPIVRRLTARQSLLAAALTCRAEERAEVQRPGDARAVREAGRAARNELVAELQWSPSKAKQAVTSGQGLAGDVAAREAFSSGALSADHARVLADILSHLHGPAHDLVRDHLLEVAQTQDPVTFGKTARRLLARADHDAAVEQLERLKRRRYGRGAVDPDGMYRLNVGVAGLDGEIAAQAIATFRRPDAPDEHRTAEQATADAVVDAFRHALDHAASPGTSTRSRPHVTVLVTLGELAKSAGVAETTWTGPLPAAELRRLLDDSTISRVITGPESLPMDTGRASRTVSPGIWRALVARDGHCTWPGCDTPAHWCQAAHLDQRWAEGAGVSLDELALACRAHHAYLDRNHWTGRIENGRVTWHPPPGGRHPADRQRAGPAP